MGIKSNLPEEIKDAVVRDYLRGDKAIVIQLEYKISPGPMYRILHEREVPLRSEGESAPVPDEGADETESVPDEGADETESVPPVGAAAAAVGLDEGIEMARQMAAADLRCEPCDQSFSTAPGKASHERSLAHRVKVADGREGGFLTAIQALVDDEEPAEVVLRRVNNLLEAHFAKDSEATLKDIGLWEKATGEGIDPTEVVNAAVETFIRLCCRALPGAEELEDGYFRIPTNEPGEPPPGLRAGGRVAHAEFGEGTVVSFKDVPDDREVVVRFDGHGVKRLRESLARLTTDDQRRAA